MMPEDQGAILASMLQATKSCSTYTLITSPDSTKMPDDRFVQCRLLDALRADSLSTYLITVNQFSDALACFRLFEANILTVNATM